MKTNLPVKRKTYVDFIRTEITLGERDGEIVVTMAAKLQLNKLPWGGIYDIYHKRFPHISRSGVFTVVGRAVCGDEKFDFEKGKRIAETRAQSKAYATATKIYEMVREEFEYAAKVAKWLSMNCEGCVTSAQEHIIDLDKDVK